MTERVDRRKVLRIPISVKVTVRKTGLSFEAQAVDISPLGIGLISPVPPAPASQVDLEIPRVSLILPGKDPPEGTMSVSGQVIFSRPTEAGQRIGVSFTKIYEEDQLLFNDFAGSPAAQEPDSKAPSPGGATRRRSAGAPRNR